MKTPIQTYRDLKNLDNTDELAKIKIELRQTRRELEDAISQRDYHKAVVQPLILKLNEENKVPVKYVEMGDRATGAHNADELWNSAIWGVREKLKNSKASIKTIQLVDEFLRKDIFGYPFPGQTVSEEYFATYYTKQKPNARKKSKK